MRRRVVAGRGGEQLRKAAACSLSLRGMHDAVPSLCDTAQTWGSSSKGGGSGAGCRAGELLAAAEHRARGWISLLLVCRHSLPPNRVKCIVGET